MRRRFRSRGVVRGALVGALTGAVVVSCGPDVMELNPGAEMTRELAASGVHIYELRLEANRWIRAVAEQQGVDVAVELYAPGGDLILRVDSPIGRQGPETVIAVAETAGTYRLEVHAAEAEAPPGKYRLSIDETRPASPEDRQRAGAEQLFSQAEELRREDTEVSRRAAVKRYEETLPLWQDLAERRREADTRLRLGWVYRLLEEFPQALEALDAALALYREADDRHGEVLALNSQGAVWIQRRSYAEAVPPIERAVTIARELDRSLLIAECFNNLGLVHRRLGEIGAALNAYGEARRFYEEFDEPYNLARIRFNLGVLLLGQGKLPEAADHLEAAGGIWTDLGKLRRAAGALSALGDCRKRQGRLDDALEILQRALELRHRAEDRRGEAATLNNLGTTYLLLERYEEARTSYEEVREILREFEDVREKAVTLVNLGRLHAVLGEPGRALDFHRQAAPLLASSADRATEASNHYGMARAFHDLEGFAAAREHLAATLDKVEELRTETRSEGLRIAFFATRQHYYDLYVDVLMHLGATEAAFEISERRRARALLEGLGSSAAEVRKHADPELLTRERALQDQLNEFEQRRTKLLELRYRDEEAIAVMEQKLRDKGFELETVRGELRDPGAAEPAPSPSFSLEDARSLLDRRTLLLSYSLGDERSFLWQISREGDIRSHVLPGREEIEAAALRAHELLSSRSPDDDKERQDLLSTLSEILLKPVADDLEEHRLLIAAEGALLYLPFAALPDPRDAQKTSPRYLVETHVIAYLPSISVLKELHKKLALRPRAPRQLAIFADPAFAPGAATEGGTRGEDVEYEDENLNRAAAAFNLRRFPALPHTRDEAEAILEITRGEVMEAIGFDATKEKALSGALAQYQILHFATHGLIHRQQPELSGLVLSLFDDRGEHQDGFLRLHEIAALDLPAELAVLSACQTGLGKEVRGEGFLGWTRTFMQAGTPRLVVSLWNVNDRATSELMKRFYWNLLEAEAPPALALRAAQLTMLRQEEWQHPFYWAGFIFEGAWWLPGEEPPIEGAEAGGAEDDESGSDYPGPDPEWCESLTEPWMKELCETLRALGDEPVEGKEI